MKPVYAPFAAATWAMLCSHPAAALAGSVSEIALCSFYNGTEVCRTALAEGDWPVNGPQTTSDQQRISLPKWPLINPVADAAFDAYIPSPNAIYHPAQAAVVIMDQSTVTITAEAEATPESANYAAITPASGPEPKPEPKLVMADIAPLLPVAEPQLPEEDTSETQAKAKPATPTPAKPEEKKDTPIAGTPPAVVASKVAEPEEEQEKTERTEKVESKGEPETKQITEETTLKKEPAKETAKAEPAPETTPASALDAESKAVLAQIPSGIDSPSAEKPERIVIEREKPEPIAAAKEQAPVDGTGKTDPKNPNAPATTDAAVPVKPKPDIDISDGDMPYSITDDLELAYSSLMAGDVMTAVKYYTNALKHDKDNEQALFGLAASYQRAGQNSQARPLYAQLLKVNPQHRGALNNFLALVAEDAPEEALTELKILEKRNPDFSPIPAQMAIIYQKLGKTSEAIAQMSQALSLSPENLAYRYNLAILLDHAGKGQDAAALYQQLVNASLRGQAIPGDLDNIQQRLTFLRSNRT